MSLQNKVAIVTGAAHGIGLTIAHRFAEEGIKVAIADIDNAQGEMAEKELCKLGEAFFYHCDVGDRLQVRNLVASTLNKFRDIDILVNNAGTMEDVNFLELEESEFDRIMQVNLKGAFLCSQAVARHMLDKKRENEGGSIINISSIKLIPGFPRHGAYSISKAGINQMTKVLAQNLAPHRIRVNAIGPGFINTKLHTPVNSKIEARRHLTSDNLSVQSGDPKEIASIAVFLASQESSYITGQTIYADGGSSALALVVSGEENS